MKELRNLKDKFLCLFISLCILISFPTNSWADAGVIDNSEYAEHAFYSSISSLEVIGASSIALDFKIPDNQKEASLYVWDITSRYDRGRDDREEPIQFNLDTAGEGEDGYIDYHHEQLNVPRVNWDNGTHVVGVSPLKGHESLVSAVQIWSERKPVEAFDTTLVATEIEDHQIDVYYSIFSPEVYFSGENKQDYLLKVYQANGTQIGSTPIRLRDSMNYGTETIPTSESLRTDEDYIVKIVADGNNDEISLAEYRFTHNSRLLSFGATVSIE
jgi:hypothetical protein